MFVDPARLVRWIGISAEIEPRPGGRFRFEVMPGQFCEGRYEIVDRPTGWCSRGAGRIGAWESRRATSQVEVTFTADGEATTLRLVHRGSRPRRHGRSTTTAGPGSSAGSVAVIEGRDPDPYPTETPEERRRWLSTS